jgi:hypothetical protein
MSSSFFALVTTSFLRPVDVVVQIVVAVEFVEQLEYDTRAETPHCLDCTLPAQSDESRAGYGAPGAIGGVLRSQGCDHVALRAARLRGRKRIAGDFSQRSIASVAQYSISARLAAYAALDPAILAALGADRFPPPPLHAVGDG